MKRVKALNLSAVLIVSLLMLAACKNSPQAGIVGGKGNLENKISQSASASSNYAAPQLWQEDIIAKAGNITIKVDATVAVPAVNAFPVAIAKADSFSQSQAERILTTLLRTNPMYEVKRVKTKEDIQNEILAIQKNIADPNSNLNNIKAINPEGYKALKSEMEAAIKKLKQQLITAPDTYEIKLASMVFQSMKESGLFDNVPKNELDKMPDILLIEGQADLGKSSKAFLQILSSADIRINNHFVFTNLDKYQSIANNPSENLVGLRNVVITKDQAIDNAQQFLTSIGLTNMALSCIGSDTIEVISPENSFDTNRSKTWPQCYVCYFSQTVGEVPLSHVSKTIWNDRRSNEPMYRQPWPEEELAIWINDTGILQIQWDYPHRITGYASNNVNLLPFDQIQDICRRQIEIQGSWDDDPAIIKREIHITDVKLGYAKIAKKDSPNECLFVPVWDFYGYSVYKYKETQPGGYILDENNEYTEKQFAHSFLTINTIDGSIINRDTGS